MIKYLFLVTAFTSVLLSNCTTNRALIRYSDIKEVAAKEGKWDGKPLGTVHSDIGGAIWDECTELAQRNLRAVVMQAQNMGANALGGFVWLPGDERESTEPVCKKRWGWFAMWPFILTPLFVSADVTAQAYNIPGLEKDSKSVYYIPKTKEGRENLIKRLLAIGK